MPPTFTFDEASHVYRAEGAIVPGVTRILEHAGMVNLSMVCEDILERKTLVGKIVHAATHYDDEGQLDWSSLEKDALPYVLAWKEFKKDSGFTPSVCELQLVAELNGMPYGMQVDRCGYLGYQDVVIDMKTGPFHWRHEVQLAAYMAGAPLNNLSSPLARYFSRKGYIVELRADRTYRLRGPFCSKELLMVFSSCLHVTHFKLKRGSELPEVPQ